MPIRKRWSRFTRENVLKLPDNRGAYELANRDKRIIDTGGSDDFSVGVRGRLLSHLNKNKYPTARYFRCEFASFFKSGIKMEASHGKKFVKKHSRKPRYTKRLPHP